MAAGTLRFIQLFGRDPLTHLPAFLASRFIRLLANIVRALCYGVHLALPRLRFRLPAESPPLIRTGKASKIPRTLWQTNYTDRVTLPLFINYLFNRLMSPTFAYRFMITGARRRFIEENFPVEVAERYDRLTIGAAQADFWRVLVLNRHGGVYLDIDGTLTWPLGLILKRGGRELYIRTRRGDLSNYFIASAPDNPNLDLLIRKMMRNIDEGSSGNVFELTGPGVFNAVLDPASVPTTLYRHTCIQGAFTNEFFQYIDKKEGKWTQQQRTTGIIDE